MDPSLLETAASSTPPIGEPDVALAVRRVARDDRSLRAVTIMPKGISQEEASLLDILIDGFEKNEILDGFHWRNLPMADESVAIRKFASLLEEARRWKGHPTRLHEDAMRRIAAWPDLEIRQAGRGVMVRARAPWFDTWWHERGTWEGDPMGPIYDWLEAERRRDRT